MFGIEAPMGRTPFQGASLDVPSPRAKARLKHLGYSVRPLRGHRKMSKLQARAGTPAPQCGTGVLARQIAENDSEISKLQSAGLPDANEANGQVETIY